MGSRNFLEGERWRPSQARWSGDVFFSIIMILKSSYPYSKLADGIFLSPQEACVFQFQIKSTSKTPACLFNCNTSVPVYPGTFASVSHRLTVLLAFWSKILVSHQCCDTHANKRTSPPPHKYLRRKRLIVQRYRPRATDDHLLSGCQNHPPPTKKKGGWGPHKHTCSDLLGLLCVSCLSPGTFSTAVLM